MKLLLKASPMVETLHCDLTSYQGDPCFRREAIPTSISIIEAIQIDWCPWRDSNPHAFWEHNFESGQTITT
jgi:hypothetical protein